MPFFGLSSAVKFMIPAQRKSEVCICVRMSVLYFIFNSLHLTSKECKYYSIWERNNLEMEKIINLYNFMFGYGWSKLSKNCNILILNIFLLDFFNIAKIYKTKNTKQEKEKKERNEKRNIQLCLLPFSLLSNY